MCAQRAVALAAHLSSPSSVDCGQPAAIDRCCGARPGSSAANACTRTRLGCWARPHPRAGIEAPPGRSSAGPGSHARSESDQYEPRIQQCNKVRRQSGGRATYTASVLDLGCRTDRSGASGLVGHPAITPLADRPYGGAGRAARPRRACWRLLPCGAGQGAHIDHVVSARHVHHRVEPSESPHTWRAVRTPACMCVCAGACRPA